MGRDNMRKKRSLHKTSFGEKAFKLGICLYLGFLLLTMIIPFWNTFVISISSNIASMERGIRFWPSEFSLEGYRTIWTGLELWRPFMNNVIVTVAGTFFHVLLAAMAGYVLVQPRLPGKKIIVSLIMITMMVPGEAIMIPLFIVFRDLRLVDTLWALIVSGMVSGFSILLMRNFFLSIPYEVSESAQIDGANDFKIFYKLYLPLAKPGIATILLFEFVGRWNHFTSALLYLPTNTRLHTLQLALRALVLENDAASGGVFFTPNVRMAGLVISMIPLLLIYPFLQRYFVKGINLGATKE